MLVRSDCVVWELHVRDFIEIVGTYENCQYISIHIYVIYI